MICYLSILIPLVSVLTCACFFSGSPFVLRVSGAPDAGKVCVTGPGIEPGILARYQSRFIVETRGAGAGQLTVRIRGPKGKTALFINLISFHLINFYFIHFFKIYSIHLFHFIHSVLFIVLFYFYIINTIANSFIYFSTFTLFCWYHLSFYVIHFVYYLMINWLMYFEYLEFFKIYFTSFYLYFCTCQQK